MVRNREYLAVRQTQGAIRTRTAELAAMNGIFSEIVGWLEKEVECKKLVLATQPERSLQIVGFACEHGCVTIGEAIKLTGASAIRALKELKGDSPTRVPFQRVWVQFSVSVHRTP